MIKVEFFGNQYICSGRLCSGRNDIIVNFVFVKKVIFEDLALPIIDFENDVLHISPAMNIKSIEHVKPTEL